MSGIILVSQMVLCSGSGLDLEIVCTMLHLSSPILQAHPLGNFSNKDLLEEFFPPNLPHGSDEYIRRDAPPIQSLPEAYSRVLASAYRRN